MFRLQDGDPVRVHLENSRRWEVPFNIQRVEKKLVGIADGDNIKPFILICVITAVKRGNYRDT